MGGAFHPGGPESFVLGQALVFTPALGELVRRPVLLPPLALVPLLAMFPLLFPLPAAYAVVVIVGASGGACF